MSKNNGINPDLLENKLKKATNGDDIDYHSMLSLLDQIDKDQPSSLSFLGTLVTGSAHSSDDVNTRHCRRDKCKCWLPYEVEILLLDGETIDDKKWVCHQEALQRVLKDDVVKLVRKIVELEQSKQQKLDNEFKSW